MATAEPYYTTPDAVRTELGLDIAALSDADALALILDTEDLIDEDLGAWMVDPATGRKIIESEVQPWQWAKLGRATTKLAAALHGNPDIATGQRWKSVRGPDFAFSGLAGPQRGPSIGSILNQTGLRRLTTSSRGGRHPSWYGFQVNVGDVDAPPVTGRGY